MTVKKLKEWSTTAASNNMAVPEGAPEGMAPSQVNNVIRQVMARAREAYEGAEWIDFGHTINSASSNQIVIAGDKSAIYTVGRSVRADGTVGRITAVAVATNTTVTVTGITFSGAPSIWEVGILQTSGLGDPPDVSITGVVTATAQSFTGLADIALTTAFASATEPRLIYACGQVQSNGTLTFGYNATSSKTATGQYEISPTAGNWPAQIVVLALTTAQDKVAYVEGDGGGNSHFILHTRSIGGSASDAGFYFAVIKVP